MSNGPFYPRGVYRCEITEQGLTKAGTGTTQVAFKVKVLRDAQGNDVEQQYERSVYLPVTEKTIEFLVPKLEALGYTRDGIRFLDLSNPQCHDLRGVEADFFCKHESGQDGVLREKWDVATGGGGKPLELKPPDPKDIRNLDMLFGRAKKNAGLVSAPRSASRSATAVAEPPDFPNGDASDEDVPL